jgi:hypothetical protein
MNKQELVDLVAAQTGVTPFHFKLLTQSSFRAQQLASLHALAKEAFWVGL